METSLVLFYYTLIVMLAVIMTAAACTASYLVSRTRALLLAAVGFLSYFFDVAIVFQDDFLLSHHVIDQAGPFLIGSPVAAVAFGGGALTALWLVACEYLEVRSMPVRAVPGILFVGMSFAVLAFMEPSYARMFCFYSMREVFLAGVLLFAAARYLHVRDGAWRVRVRRFGRIYAALWVLTVLIVAENVAFQLAFPRGTAIGDALPFFPERNFAENLLVLCCAFVACRSAWRNLAVRHEAPPRRGGSTVQAFVDEHLTAYCALRALTPRESEVLRLVLLGKDNQNIATALHLAPGTVKVHVHNILQKTNAENRQALLQDFWGCA